MALATIRRRVLAAVVEVLVIGLALGGGGGGGGDVRTRVRAAICDGGGVDAHTYHFSAFSYFTTRPELVEHFAVAAMLVQNLSDGWWDDIGDLRGNMTLHTDGTGCNALDASIQFFADATEHDLVGVLGPMCSSASGGIATLTALLSDGVPNISPSATSEALLDRGTYPYFMRTAPHDGFQTELLVSLAEELDWSYVAILYLRDDVYTTGIADGFNTLFQEANYTVLSYVGFDDTDDEAIQDALATAQSAGAKVMLLSARADSAQAVINVALEQDLMLGNGQTWLAVDGWSDSGFFFTNETYNATLANASTGFIGLTPFVNTTRTLYSEYLDLWSNFTEAEFPDENEDRSDVDTYATHAVDAVVAYGYAMSAIIALYNDTAPIWDGDTLLAALYNVSFEGVSGYVEFTNKGERQGDYEIVNADGEGNWNSLGYVRVATNQVQFTDGVDIVSSVDGQVGAESGTFDVNVVLAVTDIGDADQLERLQAMELVFDMLNDPTDGRYDDVVQDTVRFRWSLLETICSASDAAQWLESERNRTVLEAADVVIGPPCSSAATAFAAVSVDYDFPVISYSATSDTLSGIPYFARTASPDQVQVDVLEELFSLAKWDTMAVIYNPADVYSNNLYNTLSDINGIELLEVEIGSNSDDATLKAALETVDEGDSYIVVGIVLATAMKDVLRVAAAEDMLKADDGYVWVGVDSWVADSEISDTYGDHIRGAVGSGPFIDDSTTEYATFLEYWQSDVNVTQDEDGDLSTLGLFTPMVVDAVLAAARVISTQISNNRALSNATSFYSQIVDTPLSFTGVSGTVTFDDKGDRETAHALYNFVNSSTTWVTIFSGDEIDDTASLDSVQWWSGTGTIPSDTKEVDDGDDSGNGAGGDDRKGTNDDDGSSGASEFEFITAMVGLVVVIIIGVVMSYIAWSQRRDRQRRHTKITSATDRAVQVVNYMKLKFHFQEKDEIVRRQATRDSLDVGTPRTPNSQKHIFRQQSTESTHSSSASAARARASGIAGEGQGDETPEAAEKDHLTRDSKNVVAAALHCYSAIIGVPPEPKRLIGDDTYQLFTAYFSSWYQDVIFMAVVFVHMGLAFWEQKSFYYTAELSASDNVVLLLIEFICVMIYLTDVWVHWHLFPQSTFQSRKYLLYLAVIVTVTLDLMLQVTSPRTDFRFTLRFSRPLRAAIVGLHSRSLESDLRKLWGATRQVLDVGIVIIGIVILASGGAVVLFGHDIAQCDPSKIPDADMVSLRNSGNALVALIVSMTADNYPAISEAPARCTGEAARLFFLLSTFLLFIAGAIFLASLFDAWSDARAVQVNRFLELERANLLEAFNELAEDYTPVGSGTERAEAGPEAKGEEEEEEEGNNSFPENGSNSGRGINGASHSPPRATIKAGRKKKVVHGVTMEGWKALLTRMHGDHVPREFMEDAFHVVDQDHNGILDREEFVQISPILLQQVHIVSAKHAAILGVQGEQAAKEAAAAEELRSRAEEESRHGEHEMKTDVPVLRLPQGAAHASDPPDREHSRDSRSAVCTEDAVDDTASEAGSVSTSSSVVPDGDDPPDIDDDDVAPVRGAAGRSQNGDWSLGSGHLSEHNPVVEQQPPFAAASGAPPPTPPYSGPGESVNKYSTLSLGQWMWFELSSCLVVVFPGQPHLRSYAYDTRWVLLASFACIFGNVVLMFNYKGTNREHWGDLNLVDNAFMAVSLAECLFRVYVLGWHFFLHHSYAKVDVALVLTSSVAVGLFELAGAFKFATFLRFVRILRFFIVGDLIASTFGKDGYKTRRIIVRMWVAGPVLFRMLLLVFVQMYFFAVIGMELWSGRLTGNNHCSEQYSSFDALNFNSILESLNFMFTLGLDPNFANAFQTTWCLSGPWRASLYWISLYISVIFLSMNVFFAVVIDTYSHLYARHRTRVTVHRHTEFGVIRVEPSNLHRRYRVDLDLEESRREAQRETMVNQEMMEKVREEVEQRLTKHAELIRGALVFSERQRQEREERQQREREEHARRVAEHRHHNHHQQHRHPSHPDQMENQHHAQHSLLGHRGHSHGSSMESEQSTPHTDGNNGQGVAGAATGQRPHHQHPPSGLTRLKLAAVSGVSRLTSGFSDRSNRSNSSVDGAASGAQTPVTPPTPPRDNNSSMADDDAASGNGVELTRPPALAPSAAEGTVASGEVQDALALSTLDTTESGRQHLGFAAGTSDVVSPSQLAGEPPAPAAVSPASASISGPRNARTPAASTAALVTEHTPRTEQL